MVVQSSEVVEVKAVGIPGRDHEQRILEFEGGRISWKRDMVLIVKFMAISTFHRTRMANMAYVGLL